MGRETFHFLSITIPLGDFSVTAELRDHHLIWLLIRIGTKLAHVLSQNMFFFSVEADDSRVSVVLEADSGSNPCALKPNRDVEERHLTDPFSRLFRREQESPKGAAPLHWLPSLPSCPAPTLPPLKQDVPKQDPSWHSPCAPRDPHCLLTGMSATSERPEGNLHIPPSHRVSNGATDSARQEQ